MTINWFIFLISTFLISTLFRTSRTSRTVVTRPVSPPSAPIVLIPSSPKIVQIFASLGLILTMVFSMDPHLPQIMETVKMALLISLRSPVLFELGQDSQLCVEPSQDLIVRTFLD